jgi:hypothetical protein
MTLWGRGVVNFEQDEGGFMKTTDSVDPSEGLIQRCFNHRAGNLLLGPGWISLRDTKQTFKHEDRSGLARNKKSGRPADYASCIGNKDGVVCFDQLIS